MEAHVIIIEDENDIANLISLYLTREGIRTSSFDTGEKGLKALEENKYDLLVLDINLPGIDGFEALKQLRTKSNMPVVILSARQEDGDMLTGFNGGADDYVTKPFSPGVLTARIRAHLSRSFSSMKTDRSNDGVINFDKIQFDPDHFTLKNNDKRIDISRREMDLLVFLAKNQKKVFSKEEIYKEVWGNEFGDISTVTVHVQRLRKRIEADPANPKFLKTKYGCGYYLITEGYCEK